MSGLLLPRDEILLTGKGTTCVASAAVWVDDPDLQFEMPDDSMFFIRGMIILSNVSTSPDAQLRAYSPGVIDEQIAAEYGALGIAQAYLQFNNRNNGNVIQLSATSKTAMTFRGMVVNQTGAPTTFKWQFRQNITNANVTCLVVGRCMFYSRTWQG